MFADKPLLITQHPNAWLGMLLVSTCLQACGVVSAVLYVHLLSCHAVVGDPVEINAASDVLLSGQDREHPLVLLASKSWHGHGEPAAGLVALQHVAFASLQQQHLPILHLRALNPYITGIWDALPQQAARSGMTAGRQGAPLPSPSPVPAVVSSTSSFAFMGTNAHTVLRVLHSSVSSSSSRSSSGFGSSSSGRGLVWAPTQMWVAPSVRLLARIASSQHGEVVLHADLAAPQLSYIWDHRVGVHSSCVLLLLLVYT